MKKTNMFVMMKNVEKQLNDYSSLLTLLRDLVLSVDLGGRTSDQAIDYLRQYLNKNIGGDVA